MYTQYDAEEHVYLFLHLLIDYWKDDNAIYLSVQSLSQVNQ